MPEVGNANSIPDVLHHTGGSDQRESAGTELRIRALAQPFKRTQLTQLEDGDLLIKGVPMLAEGTWTDSAVGTPLFYPAKTLEEYAGNWVDKSGWARHLGGVPRKSTDKVGEAENIRFENSAVTADVRVYGFTQTGRDLQEMIRRKLISFVSVEHGGDERMNPATRQMEASSLTFTGFAFVNKGACKLCRLNEAPMLKKDDSLEGLQAILQKTLDDKFRSPSPDVFLSSPWIVMTFPDRVIYSYDGKKFEIPYMVEKDSITLGTPIEVEEAYVEKKALEMFPGADPKELMTAIQKKQDKTMDTKELEAKIAALETQNKELSAAFEKAQKPTPTPAPVEVKVEVPKELSELVTKMQAQIKALEQDGTPKTGGAQSKELEAEPINARIAIDRKAGTIRRV